MTTCRYSTCDNEAEGTGYSGRFCSPKCELRHKQIKADAMDARPGEWR